MSSEDTQQDQSMEEILQSIKNIIAEDEDSQDEATDDSSSPKDENVSGSDILELVNAVEDDDEDDLPTPSIEELIDDVVKTEEVSPEPKNIEPEPEKLIDKPKPEPLVEKPSVSIEKNIGLEDIDKAEDDAADTFSSGALLSQIAAEASSSAFDELIDATSPKEKSPSVLPDNFRSGNTVEELVMESLKPLLKEWLDDNLPTLVSKLVKREIEKITNR